MAGMMCDLASGGSANQLDASKALYALSSSSTLSNWEFCFCYIFTTHSVSHLNPVSVYDGCRNPCCLFTPALHTSSLPIP